MSYVTTLSMRLTNCCCVSCFVNAWVITGSYLVQSIAVRYCSNNFTGGIFDGTHAFVECCGIACLVQSANGYECKGHVRCMYSILKTVFVFPDSFGSSICRSPV